MSIIPNIYDISQKAAWTNHLETEGYVVIKDILNDEEYNKAMNLFKKDWNQVSPNFDFEDKETWTINNTPMMFCKGMAVFNGFGQSDFMWYLRTNKKIQSIFSNIHNTDELVVSLDGFSVFVSDKQKSKPWLHVDQNPKNPIYCVQGSYNFFPVEEDGAGFVVVPKSHKEYIPEVSHSKNWIMCEEENLIQNSKKLLIPGNCFTVWNSKCIHANEGMKRKGNHFNRLTTYISYLPKDIRSQDILEEKIKAYLNSETTSHWSNKCEIKKYPWGFKKNYENKGFGHIKPKIEDNKIPDERYILL